MIDFRAPALSDGVGARITAMLGAALHAVDPREAVAAAVVDEGLDRAPRGSVLVVAMGKAAPAMATALHETLGDRIRDGIVVGKSGVPPRIGVMRGIEGAHPVPDASSLAAGVAVAAIAGACREGDTLVVALSGGASALVVAPEHGVPLADLATATRALLRAAVDIEAINAVRKHLDRLKAGRLARMAAPARVVTLVLSDVASDALDAIGSGPTAGDPSTWADAARAIDGLSVPASVSAAVRQGVAGQRSETPGRDDPLVRAVVHRIVGSNRHATSAAALRARQLGYRVETGEVLQGQACDAGLRTAQRIAAWPADVPACLIEGGETTVHVRGSGRGGRNQELALAAVAALSGTARRRLVALATDGEDGPTDAAGAVVSEGTAAAALEAGVDARDHLARNDAYAFFDAVGGLLRPGPTGTNVGDLLLAIVDPRA